MWHSFCLKSLSLFSVKLPEDKEETPFLVLVTSKRIPTTYSIDRLRLMKDAQDHSSSFLLEKVEHIRRVPLTHPNLEGVELEVEAYSRTDGGSLAWKFF